MSDPAPSDSDAHLVQAISGGDQAALRTAYERHGGAVWSLAHRVCQNRHLADEICQTVFTDLWTTPDRYSAERGRLRTWLLTQAHARAVDAVRSESSRRHREDRVAHLAPGNPADTEAAAQLAVLNATVRDALSELPDDQRQAILLTYFGGHTYTAAAQLLEQPEGTVKSRIRAGLQRLRQILHDQGVNL